MGKEDSIDSGKYQKIIERLDHLLQRIERLETYLGIPYEAGHELPPKTTNVDSGTRLELNVGEYGLAWAGSIILFLGIIFLTIFMYRQGHFVIANVLAYTTAGVLFLLSRYWRRGITHLSRLMAVGTTVFLFYATARLHYFTANALIGNSAVVIPLLIPIVALQFYWTLSYGFSPFLALAVFLGIGTALLANHWFFTPLMIFAVFAPAVRIAIRKRWLTMWLISMVLVYAADLIWILNNPVAGHPIGLSPFCKSNVPFLFLIAAASIVPILFGQSEFVVHPFTIVTLILNCFVFSILAIGAFYESPALMAIVSLIAAGFLVAASVLQWTRRHLELPSAFMASFGFLNLSISIGLHEAFPGAFIYLALQSLLVLSMSLWFRSKALVVMNSLIYCGILFLYLVLSPSSHVATFLFAVVALISARILNWQKERLTLQTGALRNVYLGIAFVLILYGLYRAVPAEYVTLSWTAAAVGYFFLSYLLNNVKYRWMGTLAVIVTVFYLLIIDLPRLNMTYRIIAFLFLGVMALLISLFYTRIRRLLSRP
jgi:hypothetical protein